MGQMRETALRHFAERFGTAEGARVFFAPGRVNLIGEHTDYNGGHVFPCALTLGTYAAVRKRADRTIRFFSSAYPEEGVIERQLGDYRPLSDRSWTAYPCGVLWSFAQKGLVPECGFDMAVASDLPSGAGLSSSASLEVLTGVVLRALYGFSVSGTEIALLTQYGENRYNGTNCGIMDQFASAMGREDHALFLDTNTLDCEAVPLHLGGRLLIVTNTNKTHTLNESAYNDRRRECAEALAAIRQGLRAEACRAGSRAPDAPDPGPIRLPETLGELTEAQFEAAAGLIADGVQRKRARHAVIENQRTIRAVQVLKDGDLAAFGTLMNESHASLRDDYEVSCPELDLLAETAQRLPGVYGSRMTGGGFGGCTVSIVEPDAEDVFRRTLSEIYRKTFGYDCTFYTVSAGGGARELSGDSG